MKTKNKFKQYNREIISLLVINPNGLTINQLQKMTSVGQLPSGKECLYYLLNHKKNYLHKLLYKHRSGNKDIYSFYEI